MMLHKEIRMPERDFVGTGYCVKSREDDVVIDTFIIHSCYVDSHILNPVISDSDIAQNGASEESVRALLAEIDRLNSYDIETKIRKNYEQRCADLFSKACHDLILCTPSASLDIFSIEAMVKIFHLYGVSAHYIIDRYGEVFELLPPEKLAFHAGPSKMPREEDGRESVNQFSIGAELLAAPGYPITAEQYQALADLTLHLRKQFPLKNFYGHCDIAPGRKTDPEGFDWKLYRELAGLSEDDYFPKGG